MLNRRETAAIHAFVAFREAQVLQQAGAAHKGTVYHPDHGHIIGFNFGTRVRPDVMPVRIQPDGFETVASFLARGGRIVKGAPKVAKGALLVRTIPVTTKRGHNRTGQIVRRILRPSGMTASSIISIAREARLYNGAPMKMQMQGSTF